MHTMFVVGMYCILNWEYYCTCTRRMLSIIETSLSATVIFSNEVVEY